MIKTLIATLVLVLSSPALAQDSPENTPAQGFQRSGLVDAIYADEATIVINDIPNRFSQNVVVHSISSYRVPFAHVRQGARVGYRMDSGGEIVELWLLPADYSERHQR